MEVPPNSLDKEEVNTNNDLGWRALGGDGGRKEPAPRSSQSSAGWNNINSLPWTAPRSSQSSAEWCKINIKHNKQCVEGTSNRAEPSSFSPNRGHFCQDGGCGGHPLARGTWVTSESEAAVDL